MTDDIDAFLRAALAEDLDEAGDVTSRATIPEDARARAHIVARGPGCIAGLEVALRVFTLVDPEVRVERAEGAAGSVGADGSVRAGGFGGAGAGESGGSGAAGPGGGGSAGWNVIADGSIVSAGTRLATVEGAARSLLAAERLALNLLGHLSGIATATRSLVDRVQGTRATIVDTRKTTPTMRSLEKAAVRAGGGGNHRMGLYDAVLIKDNHVQAVGSVEAAVRKARRTVDEVIAASAFGERAPGWAAIGAIAAAVRRARVGSEAGGSPGAIGAASSTSPPGQAREAPAASPRAAARDASRISSPAPQPAPAHRASLASSPGTADPDPSADPPAAPVPMFLEVEIDRLEDLEAAITAGADVVLLDNMDPATMRAAVERAAGRCLLEASGGITLETVREVAESGVDFISVGWITHSAPALDVALDFES